MSLSPYPSHVCEHEEHRARDVNTLVVGLRFLFVFSFFGGGHTINIIKL